MDSLVDFSGNDVVIDSTRDIYVFNAGHYEGMIRPDEISKVLIKQTYYLFYIFKGNATVRVDNTVETYPEGNLFIFGPNDTVQIRFDSHPCDAYFIEFYGNRVKNIFAELQIGGIKRLNIGVDYTLSKLINASLNAMTLKQVGSPYIFMGNLLNIFAKISQYYLYQKKSPIISNEKFNDVLIAMNDLNATSDLKKYADMCNMSISRFSHLFKESFGISPHKYQTQVKMEKAQELLATSNYSVKELACILGYDDSYYFSRLFKKYLSKSPKKFRDELMI